MSAVLLQHSEYNAPRYGQRDGRIARSITRFMQGPSPAQLGLYEELALARTLLADIVKVYDSNTPDVDDESKLTPQARALRVSNLIGLMPKVHVALDAVRGLAKAAADIESAISIQPMLVASLAQTLQHTIYDICGANIELRDRFEHNLSSIFSMLKTPADQAEVLSPHDTIAAMDKCVPYVDGIADISAADTYEKGGEHSDDERPQWTTLDELERMSIDADEIAKAMEQRAIAERRHSGQH